MGDERICIVQNVLEVPLDIEEQLLSVKVPSDEGLNIIHVCVLTMSTKSFSTLI